MKKEPWKKTLKYYKFIYYLINLRFIKGIDIENSQSVDKTGDNVEKNVIKPES